MIPDPNDPDAIPNAIEEIPPGEGRRDGATGGSSTESVNAIGPGGDTANTGIGEVVSGQPAGGPYDIGAKAADETPDD